MNNYFNFNFKSPFKVFEGELGRVFFVADIHCHKKRLSLPPKAFEIFEIYQFNKDKDKIIVLGDGTDHGRKGERRELKTFFEKYSFGLISSSCVYYVPGNHDVNACSGMLFSNKKWQDDFTYFACNKSDSSNAYPQRIRVTQYVDLLLLNTTMNTINLASGKVDYSQKERLHQMLKKIKSEGKKAIICMHHNLFSPRKNLPLLRSVIDIVTKMDDPGDELLKLFQEFSDVIPFIMHGHTHESDEDYLPQCPETRIIGVKGGKNVWQTGKGDRPEGCVRIMYTGCPDPYLIPIKET